MIILMVGWRQRKERQRWKYKVGVRGLWCMIKDLREGTFFILMEREDRVIGMRIEVKWLRLRLMG